MTPESRRLLTQEQVHHHVVPGFAQEFHNQVQGVVNEEKDTGGYSVDQDESWFSEAQLTLVVLARNGLTNDKTKEVFQQAVQKWRSLYDIFAYEAEAGGELFPHDRHTVVEWIPGTLQGIRATLPVEEQRSIEIPDMPKRRRIYTIDADKSVT